eukprot:2775627-Amphidinium_carterae.1
MFTTTHVVVIGIDGMQKLPGFSHRSSAEGKGEPFYKVMEAVCGLINANDGPLMIGCVAATQSLGHALADSPQARTYIWPPQVTHVTANGEDKIPWHALKPVLVRDMGGHGRALEGLVEALGSLQSAEASAVMGAVMIQMQQKYPDAAMVGDSHTFHNEDIEQIIVASLSGKWIAKGALVGKVNPEKAMLMRLCYKSPDNEEYRINLPYIWLHMMLKRESLDPRLHKFRMMDYADILKPPSGDGEPWEDFNADFRVLRSLSFNDETRVKVQELHRGAIIRPDTLGEVRVINRHLERHTAVNRATTRSSVCGNSKAEKAADDSKPAKGCNNTSAG